MLIGYSLEVSLKGMLIIKQGVSAYQAEEKRHLHHNLERLSGFIPDLSEKDKAILRGLSHFVRWAGRYPDPGSGRAEQTEEIFALSSQHDIDIDNILELVLRILGHVKKPTLAK